MPVRLPWRLPLQWVGRPRCHDVDLLHMPGRTARPARSEKPQNWSQVFCETWDFCWKKMVNWESETANDVFFNAKSIKTILEKVTTLVGCSEKKAMLNFLRSKEWDGRTHIMCPGYQDSLCFFTLSTLLVLAGPTKHCRNPTSSSF